RHYRLRYGLQTIGPAHCRRPNPPDSQPIATRQRCFHRKGLWAASVSQIDLWQLFAIRCGQNQGTIQRPLLQSEANELSRSEGYLIDVRFASHNLALDGLAGDDRLSVLSDLRL